MFIISVDKEGISGVMSRNKFRVCFPFSGGPVSQELHISRVRKHQSAREDALLFRSIKKNIVVSVLFPSYVFFFSKVEHTDFLYFLHEYENRLPLEGIVNLRATFEHY